MVVVMLPRRLFSAFLQASRRLATSPTTDGGYPKTEGAWPDDRWRSFLLPSRAHFASNCNTVVASRLQERTLIAVKPDGVQRRLVGEIIQRFEQRGFKLVGMKLIKASEDLLREHYIDLKRKPFYPSLIQYMNSGPIVVMVWEGYNVVKTSRLMVGATDPAEALPGTIRGDFGMHISRNVIHASDSVEVADREIGLWFSSIEMTDWECCTQSNIYSG
ncbi:nucleoside diphosphate kinase A-like [Protopterus annectens]|uniref:nucleoside diphosphate kinase A-like n=1 Tax=Protopterus annectens TaxID=7888 RepID=UPI001CFBD2FD|nr:nucleoside diphosphate kinase A-like [Protopterus annectens]